MEAWSASKKSPPQKSTHKKLQYLANDGLRSNSDSSDLRNLSLQTYASQAS